MTDTITIQPAALEAAAKAVWKTDEPSQWELCMVRTACLAMLKEWPGIEYMMGDEAFPFHHIILPLTQENTNAEALTDTS